MASADRLVANTHDEARQLIGHYAADPARVTTINPGVDLSVFTPGSQLQARQQLGLPPDGVVLVFAGRVQPLKAPDVVLHAAAQLIDDDPDLAGQADDCLCRRPERHRPARSGRARGAGGATRPDRAGAA